MVKQFLENVRSFFKDERGASAVEYGLIVGLIAVALIAVLLLVSGDDTSGLNGLFTTVSNEVNDAASTAP